MDTGTQILIGMLLGCVGFGYIVYGRKQMKASALLAGIALCIFPYFIHSLWLTLLLAAGIGAVPFFIAD